MTLADAPVFDDSETEAHWKEEAKALIAGILFYVVCHDDAAHRNLTCVRDYLTLAPCDFTALRTVMQASNGAGGLIATRFGYFDCSGAAIIAAQFVPISGCQSDIKG